MSKRGRDTGKRPTKRSAAPTRMSSKINQVGPVNYAETDLTTPDTEREGTIVGSDSGFGSVKLEVDLDSEQIEAEGDWVEDTWTPITARNTATQVGLQFAKIAEQNSQLIMARETEQSAMDKLMEMMLTMRMEEQKREDRWEREREQERREDRLREEKRREREEQKEEEREERRRAEKREQEDRQATLLAQLKEAQPAVPQNITIQKEELPKMKERDDIELYVDQLEEALVASTIPERKWKTYLHSQLTLKTKQKVIHLLKDVTSSYEDIKEALMGCAAMTFRAASEAFYSADRGKLSHLPLREAAEKLRRWAGKISQESEDIDQALDYMTLGALRSMMVPDLKAYIDISKQNELQPFLRTAEEWERSQPQSKPVFKQNTSIIYSATNKTAQVGTKKQVTCFFCNKVGHISCECRTRLAGENSIRQQQPVTTTPTTPVGPTVAQWQQREKKPIMCFVCHQVGHKSPQCPKKQQSSVKRIQIPVDCVKVLGRHEVMGSIGGTLAPITIDSGAELTLVPEEMVTQSQFTGENKTFNDVTKNSHVGKMDNIVIQIGGRDYAREAVAVPGSDISWTTAMSVDFQNREEWSSLLRQIDLTTTLTEEETHFLPPCMEEGVLQGAARVSQGIVVEARDTPQLVTSALQPHSEEAPVNTDHAEVEVSEIEAESEQSLVPEQSTPSVSVSVEEEMQGGSLDTGDEVDVCVKDIVNDEPRNKLGEAILADNTLATARSLGDTTSEGYHWVEQLLFRTRFDSLGDNVEQLCLPQPYRARCLRLAHENFGHVGRNKMCLQIRKLFYWPSMNSDVSKHCKSCTVCQKRDKQLPKQMTMQPREVVTVPSERVAIDIVGPFPVAKGGFTYLLTYLDMATRWPEAIPLKKTTTRIVIDQLMLIFSRNGFPTTHISDNGPQFISNLFEKFLKSKGIAHVKASPYHPQGNGVIERMHRTLTNIIAKCTETKGNWAQVVPMALYILRCMPCRSTGLSPIALKHGWEPTTPFQLLYKGWVQDDLGSIDLEDWVMENSDRVQRMRDSAVATRNQTTDQRKREWDRKAQTRMFDKGDKVYFRKSGLNTKLSDSWVGPYVVEKRNSRLSYRVNSGDRVLQSVHVQLLKQYAP